MDDMQASAPSGVHSLGSLLADFFLPFATDPGASPGYEEAQPLLLGDNLVGGRTRLGPPVHALHRWGIAASVVLFSWASLLPFLLRVGDTWCFVPVGRSELLRVTLQQRIVRQRIAPAAVAWAATLFVGMIIAAATAKAATEAGSPESAKMLMVASALVLVSAWLGGNWILLSRVRHLGESIFRTGVRVDYGYPDRTPLLDVISDGTQEEQLARVQDLLRRVPTYDFAPWEQTTVEGTSGAGVSLAIEGGGEMARRAVDATTTLAGLGMSVGVAVWLLSSVLGVARDYRHSADRQRDREAEQAFVQRQAAEERARVAAQRAADERIRTNPTREDLLTIARTQHPADLSNRDLHGATLAGFDLSGANLSGANLSGATLANANLSRANLAGANLTGAMLTSARIDGANFTDANLSRVALVSLTGVREAASTNFTRANLSDATLEVSVEALGHAPIFSGATLRGAGVSGSLWSVSFSGADLRGANFSRFTSVVGGLAFVRGARCDETTRFPEGFAADPEVRTLCPSTQIESSVASPSPTSVVETRPDEAPQRRRHHRHS